MTWRSHAHELDRRVVFHSLTVKSCRVIGRLRLRTNVQESSVSTGQTQLYE